MVGATGLQALSLVSGPVMGLSGKKKTTKKTTHGEILAGGPAPRPRQFPCSFPKHGCHSGARQVSTSGVRKVHARSPPFPARPALGGGSPPGGQCGSERGAGDLLGDAPLLGVGWGLCRVRRPSSFTPRGSSLQRPLPPAPREFSVAARTNDPKPTATKQRTFIFSQSGGQKSLGGGSLLPARAREAPGTQPCGRVSHLCLPFRRPSSLFHRVWRRVCKDRF